MPACVSNGSDRFCPALGHPMSKAVGERFGVRRRRLRGGYAACAGDQRRVVLFPVILALVALGLVGAVAVIWVRLSRKRRVL